MKKNIFIIGVILIIIFLVISNLFLILMHKQIKEEASLNMKGGYWVNKTLRITNLDVYKHNSTYEIFVEGKHNKEELIKIIDFISYMNCTNIDNEAELVDIQMKEKKYRLSTSGSEDYNEIKQNFNNTDVQYLVNLHYSQQTGLVDLIEIIEL